MDYLLNTTDTPLNAVFTSGSNAVTGGADSAGWVSGDIASLAASATVDVIFDLGPKWQHINWVMVSITPVTPSSGLSAVMMSGSDTAAFNATRRLQAVNSLSFGVISAALTSANGSQMLPVKPFGRFFIIRATNADASNAQGATAHATIATYQC